MNEYHVDTNQPTNNQVHHSKDPKPKDITRRRVVLVRVIQREVLVRIFCCKIPKPNDAEEKHARYYLERRVDLSKRLKFVPLVRYKIRSPDGDRSISVALAFFLVLWRKGMNGLRALPVDEENVNV